MKIWTSIIGMVFVLVAVAPLARQSKDYEAVYAAGDRDRRVVNSSALATILGEARTNLSDFIWVKTEVYSHRGIRFQAHMDEEDVDHDARIISHELEQQAEDAHRHEHDHQHDHGRPRESEHADEHQHEHDEPCDHDHARAGEHEREDAPDAAHTHVHDDRCRHEPGHKALLVIPAEDTDFRGFIGRIDRAVHPWGDHHFETGEDNLPWYRVLTIANPRHSRAYLVGGWLLMGKGNHASGLEEAESFLLEGIANNPQVFALRVMLGRVNMRQEQWSAAIEQFELARDLALKFRPAGGRANDVWSDGDEEDFGFAVRYIPFIQLTHLQDRDAARASTRAALRHIPRDTPLNNYLRRLDGEEAHPDAGGLLN